MVEVFLNLCTAVIIARLSTWLSSVWKDRINSRDNTRTETFIELLKAGHSRLAQNLEHALQI